jgi:predicted NUDIX family phosphoesterase
VTRILVVPRSAVGLLPDHGAWPVSAELDCLPWQWLDREQAEMDEHFLQIIPYALLQNTEGRLWCYQRLGGDVRVRHRWSCGVGGHVDETDPGDSVRSLAASALQRELEEELAWTPDGDLLQPHAWLYEGVSAIGRVHLGLIYVLPWTASASPMPTPGEPLDAVGFCPSSAIVNDDRFEFWSRLAAAWSISRS